MPSSSNHFILLLLPFLSSVLFLPIISYSDDLIVSHCDAVSNNNQSNTATFNDKMLSDLATMSSHTGFVYSYYYDPGVYGLAWCRGDFSSDQCSSCLTNATAKLVDVCSHAAIVARLVLQDFCYLRLDVVDFNMKLDTSFSRILYDNSTDQIAEAHRAAYKASVRRLVSGLKRAIPHQEKRFGQTNVSFDIEDSKMYGMGQCLGGLSAKLCQVCLDRTMEALKANCMYRRSCEIFYESCFLRYYIQKN